MSFIYRLTLIVLLSGSVAVLAEPDVTKKSNTRLDFKGTLGAIMKIAGAEKPTFQAEYLKGNRKRIDKLDKKGKIESSQIIDLDREVIIQIDYDKKRYTEMTFAQYRELLKRGLSALTQSGKSTEEEKDREDAGQEKPEVHLKFDMKVERPGDRRKVAGYEAEKIVLILEGQADIEATEQEAGEKQKARGRLRVTSTGWYTNEVSALEEEQAFNQQFIEKLGIQPIGDSGHFIKSIAKSNPELAEAFEKMREESKKIEGLPLSSRTVFETWGESDQDMEEQAEKDVSKSPPSVGGLLRGFGKKFAKKKKEEDNGAKVLLESETEIVEYSTKPLPDSQFAIPENFKRVEIEQER